MKFGLDRLVDDASLRAPLAGRRVALLAHPASVTRDLVHGLDALAALPDDTQVCCAHEYTLSNLRFAQAVEPHNADLTLYLEQCQIQRDQGQPTLPSTIQTELNVNPFMRSRAADVIAAAVHRDPQTKPREPASVLATLRQWKNVF